LEKVYLTGDFISNSLPAWLIKRKRKDVIILSNFFHRNPTPHERQGTSFFISFFSRLLQTVSLKLMKSMSDRVFVLSEVGKNELLKEGFDSAKIVISGAGMEKSIISKYTNIPKIDNQLIFLGRLDKTKGIFDLIHILDKLNKLNENFVCKIVGSGHDQTIQQLNNLANQFGINNKIEFLGYVSEQVKYELLASSQTLLLPSKEEGYSIVIQEALYLSTEVVCYELPALKVLFGAYDTVHFVSLNDVANFAREINNVIIRKNIKKVEDNFSSWDDVFSIQSKYF
jgi:glycosyltransferase involved in cell wall biosynthesis